MYKYDIRNQIITESRNKIFSELGIIGLLFAVALCIIFSGKISNPFKVSRPVNDGQLESAYLEGTHYIELDNMELEYIGYNRENGESDVIYNCYNTTFDGLTYLVFVDVEHSIGEADQPAGLLNDYQIKAKLIEDDELFDFIAKDYDLNAEDFRENYKISPIIFDAANTDRADMLVVCWLFFLLIVICLIYIIISFYFSKDVMRNKEVNRLSQYGNPNTIIEEINSELLEKKHFDNNILKITDKWILAFYNGKVLIRTRDQLEGIEITYKTKKQYGFVKIGQEVLIELTMENGDVYRLPVESEVEAEEIITVLKDTGTPGQSEEYGIKLSTFKSKKTLK